MSQSSVIEMTQLDPGESYCFSVQAFIPSRAYSKQLGEESRFQCSQEEGSILKGQLLLALAGVLPAAGQG